MFLPSGAVAKKRAAGQTAWPFASGMDVRIVSGASTGASTPRAKAPVPAGPRLLQM